MLLYMHTYLVKCETNYKDACLWNTQKYLYIWNESIVVFGIHFVKEYFVFILLYNIALLEEIYVMKNGCQKLILHI